MESFLVYLFNFYYAISELEQNKQNNTIIFFLLFIFLTKKWTSTVCGGVRAHPSHPPPPPPYGPDINELCLKLSKTVGILSKVRHFVNKHILVMLYYSLIYPFLTYAVHVWGLTFNSLISNTIIHYPKKSNQNNIFLGTKIPF